MSADRQRLKSAIRRIALTPEERRQLLGEGKNKGGKPNSSGVGTSEAEESRLCCDGSTSDNANPGTGERDPDAESQDGLDSDDPAKLSNGDGTLSGVTDCATGEPICFHGSGFIPPEGWDDPQDPPAADEEFTPDESIYWSQNEFDTDPHHRTKGQIKDLLMGLVVSGREFSHFEIDDDDVVRACYGSSCNSWIQVSRRDCEVDGISDTEVGALYCGTQYNWPEDYLEEFWPADGCTNLAIIGGTIVGSKYDPENDGSYSAPRDSIDLCDANGNQISLAPSADGGWKTLNSTEDNGYLYDSSGTQIAHIDGNEYSDPSV